MKTPASIALILAACCALGSACSEDHISAVMDGGTIDDGGQTDAGQPDAGTSDAGTSDAGTSDAGTGDAGTSDAGTSDAGISDAGTSDAGAGDAGASDAGTSDAGACTATADYGTVDAGATEAVIYDRGDGVYEYTAHLNAAAAPDIVHMQLWSGFGVFANGVVPGTYVLGGDELNDATCGLCLLIETDTDATGAPVDTYFATGGTIAITQVTPTLIGTMTNATFTHVLIDATGRSAPAGDGCTAEIESLAFDAPVGTGITCTASADYGTVDPSASETASYDANYDAYDYSADLNSVPDQLVMQLYDGEGVFARGVVPGTYLLGGDELNYATCGLCLLIYPDSGSGGADGGSGDTDGGNGGTTGADGGTDGGGDIYFATGGTVTITEVTPSLIGALTDVTFTHVTIDPTTYESTPVGDGCDSEIDSMAFSASDPAASRRPSRGARRRHKSAFVLRNRPTRSG